MWSSRRFPQKEGLRGGSGGQRSGHTHSTRTFRDNDVYVGTLYDVNGNVLKEFTEADQE